MKHEQDKIVSKIVSKVVAFTCDSCKKTYNKKDHVMEFQEFSFIRLNCGYDSIFGDMNFVTCDLCQHCLKKKLGNCLKIHKEGEY